LAVRLGFDPKEVGWLFAMTILIVIAANSHEGEVFEALKIKPLVFDVIQVSALGAMFAEVSDRMLRRRLLIVPVTVLWTALVVSVVMSVAAVVV
jgi:hypothetical protein